MAVENEFEPHLGRLKDQGAKATKKARSFVSEVTAAARRAGGGTADLGGRRPMPGRGRGASRFASHAATRRVIVKARVIRHGGARFRAAPLAMHIRYLRREGVQRDGQAGEMFDREGQADHEAFAERSADDRHHFRFIVSPEDAEKLEDLRTTTRELMARAERDLGTRLDWVAVDHWNTDNPHVHVLVRGVTEDGADLVISRDYMGRGLREQAEALVSLELGPRTQREISASLDKEVAAERLTSLDKSLRRQAQDGVVDLRVSGGRFADGQARLVGRAKTLERFGLAQPVGAGRWSLVEDLERRLQALGERDDIIKTLHRAMGGKDRDPSSLAMHGVDLVEPIAGRLADRGLHDELTGAAYVVVDGIDGRLHHFFVEDLGRTGDTPIGGIVEVRTRRDDQTARIEVIHRSDLSLDAQVAARGATWLDRRMVASSIEPPANQGFGAEVADALGRRQVWLQRQGLGTQSGERFTPARKLLATLRDAELTQVVKHLEGETKTPWKPGAEGDPVSGVYRRRLDLVSGRFAMVDDGLGFQLVPWTRSLEAHLGREVTGTLTQGGGVDWALGRKRGLGI
jgi:type IV secretory pathway VirD2 relaxase